MLLVGLDSIDWICCYLYLYAIWRTYLTFVCCCSNYSGTSDSSQSCVLTDPNVIYRLSKAIALLLLWMLLLSSIFISSHTTTVHAVLVYVLICLPFFHVASYLPCYCSWCVPIGGIQRKLYPSFSSLSLSWTSLFLSTTQEQFWECPPLANGQPPNPTPSLCLINTDMVHNGCHPSQGDIVAMHASRGW